MTKYAFDAEVGNVLSLMINSIYTNKDIFLRELISNASDACDKLRYLSIETGKVITEEELKIVVTVDKDSHTIVIQDNGVGMSEEDLKNNLGIIAKSGTKAFAERLKAGEDSKLIGQFGVGFYSAFMVADKVTVLSRFFDDQETYVWESDGLNSFTIDKSDEKLERGTKIILHIKPEESNYLDKFRLRHIIQTYSEYVAFPIELVSTEEEGKSERVNKGLAIWSRSKNEVSNDEYKEFYRRISYLPGEPWLTIHNKVEGKITYNSLIFIPDTKPFDLFHHEVKNRVKLYIKRVFIADEAVKLIPNYLRFLRGVIDSEDLPLNVSREITQQSHIIDQIRASVIKKVFQELNKKAEKDPEDFSKFWSNFGEVIKEGLCEPVMGDDKEILLGLSHFYTSKSPDKLVRLSDYIKKLPEEEKEIYYICGDSVDSIKNNPQLENFEKKGIEVLFFTHRVDDFWVQVIHDYQGKVFTSINKAGINLEEEENISKEDNNKVLEYFRDILGDKVKEVISSAKLGEKSPVCLSLPEGQMSTRIETILMQQNQLKSKSKKILEINLKHPIIQKISQDLENGLNAEDIVMVLYSQACLIEGEPVEEPYLFAQKMNNLLLSKWI